MREITLLLHDIRSIHNVGSVLRTAEGFGIRTVHLSGYTPYPPLEHDDRRLPHIRERMAREFHKTALGAELLVTIRHSDGPPIEELRQKGYAIIGLEQGPAALPLPSFQPQPKIALLLGEEVRGISPCLRRACETLVEIPMFGQKESFNVSVAAGIALYHLACLP